ncbi:MAG: hypothetical protein WEE69_02180 [Acidimicrobiia bacterium]
MHAEGIDAIVEGLLDQPKVKVTVVVPAEARGVVEVPIATAGDDVNAVLQAEAVHCDSTLEDPADDVEAFNNGFVTLTDVPAD